MLKGTKEDTQSVDAQWAHPAICRILRERFVQNIVFLCPLHQRVRKCPTILTLEAVKQQLKRIFFWKISNHVLFPSTPPHHKWPFFRTYRHSPPSPPPTNQQPANPGSALLCLSVKSQRYVVSLPLIRTFYHSNKQYISVPVDDWEIIQVPL